MTDILVHNNGGEKTTFEVIKAPAYSWVDPTISAQPFGSEAHLKEHLSTEVHPSIKLFDIQKIRGEYVLVNISRTIPKSIDDTLINTSLESTTLTLFYDRETGSYHTGDAAVLMVTKIFKTETEIKTSLSQLPIDSISNINNIYKLQFEDEIIALDAFEKLNKFKENPVYDWIEEVELNMCNYNYYPSLHIPTLEAPSESTEFPEESERLAHIKLINGLDCIHTLGELEPVKVSVFDCGITTQHPDLKVVNSLDSYDTIFRIFGSHHGSNENHGTNCAGIIGAKPPPQKTGAQGLAPNSQIHSYRIAFGAFKYDNFQIIDAFNRAITSGIKVINCSWTIGAPSYALKKMIQKVVAANIAVVFAAGNKGLGLGFPAKIPEVITIGGTNRAGLPKTKGSTINLTGLITEWSSNHGTQVLLSAPGEMVFTTDLLNDYGAKGDYTFFSGTSAAAPIISAAICIAFGMHPDIRLDTIKIMLKKSVKAFNKHDQKLYGCGLFNLKSFINKLKNYKP